MTVACAIHPVLVTRGGEKAFALAALRRLAEDPRVSLRPDGAGHVVVISHDPFAALDVALQTGRSAMVHAIGARAADRPTGADAATARAAGRAAAEGWLRRAEGLLAGGAVQ
jgi:hypothetical protein